MTHKQKGFIIFLVILISVNFFNPFGIIEFTLSKVLFTGICLLGIFTCKIKKIQIFDRSLVNSYMVLIVSMLLSYFICFVYNEQSFWITLKACSHFILAYAFFYVLMGYQISNEKIIHVIKIICVFSMVVCVVNYISFPTIIFGTENNEYDTSRGLVRLGVPCIELIVLLFLFFINQYQVSNKRKYLYSIGICFVFIVLSLTRQIILYSVVLGALLYFKSVPLWKKILFVVLCVGFSLYVLPNIGLFQSMQELTNEQISKNNEGYENIRLIAWRLFTDELQTNDITRVLGNGYPVVDASPWSIKVLATYKMMQCFPTDVGWAAFYFYYGIIATISLAFILFRAVLMRKTKYGYYLTCWFLFVILSDFTSGMILYPNQIISITLALYLVYNENCKQKSQLINK